MITAATRFLHLLSAIAFLLACSSFVFGNPEGQKTDSTAVLQPVSATDSASNNPQIGRTFSGLALFEFFPNPTEDFLHVRGKNISSIEIINMVGYVVVKKTGREEEFERIDLSKYPEGLYFVRVTTIDGLVGIEKFIKK